MSNPQKRKKLTLTLKDKHEIIKRIDDGDNYQQITKTYGIGRTTIYDICKNRDSIVKAAKMPQNSERRTLKTEDYPELEEKLHQWYLAERHLYPITGSLIMLKARTIHKEMTGKDDFLASSGWLNRFKKRRGIILGSLCVGRETNETKKQNNKASLVPTCKTTISKADKIFFNVPINEAIRKKWTNAYRRSRRLSSKCSLHCCETCEEHVNVENDTRNYMHCTLGRKGNAKPKLHLKQGVLPHKNRQQKTQQRMADISDTNDDDDDDIAVKEEPQELLDETSEFAVKIGKILIKSVTK